MIYVVFIFCLGLKVLPAHLTFLQPSRFIQTNKMKTNSRCHFGLMDTQQLQIRCMTHHLPFRE